MSMHLKHSRWLLLLVCLLGSQAFAQEKLEPIVYRLHFQQRAQNRLIVECKFPTDKYSTIELMMPIWSPGFYRLENHAGRIDQFVVRTAAGKPLVVDQPQKNRWRIQTNGNDYVYVTYRLLCDQRAVTLNWVGNDHAVIHGPATFITRADAQKCPHDVRLELPKEWKHSMTSLPPLSSEIQHRYLAPDYDLLLDSPIVAGPLKITEFKAGKATHFLVAFGDLSKWDEKVAVKDISKLVDAHQQFWGKLPFEKYAFLLSLTRGSAGLEHLNSTLININPETLRTPRGYQMWLNLMSHEYFHAINVKRLRPLELGPFDYEKEPRTKSLWVSEGLSSYYGDLLVHRAGLSNQEDVLGRISSYITQLQNNPGRLVQSLEEASSDVWTSSFSGVGSSTKTVSYYVKGPVVGFLLDMHIRRLTKDAKSLDDVMRLANEKYSGEKGFTPSQFIKVVEDVAGVDLKSWFHRTLSTATELDYTDALNWLGLDLQTLPGNGGVSAWKLRVRDKATAEQKAHLKSWLKGKSGAS